MISTRRELRDVLRMEKKLYINDAKHSLRLFLLNDHDYLIWKFVKALRYTEYYYNSNKKIQYYYWQSKKNIIGAKLGITIWHNTCGKGLKIWHYGSVVINGHAVIGENCQFHGMNCVGNKGEGDIRAPHLGNNIDVGVGAVIIGDVYIADNVKIGANAIVTKSCNKVGAVLVGNPARERITAN